MAKKPSTLINMVVALLLGAIYLLARRVIEFVTPLTILLTVFVFTGICHLVNPANFIAPWYHIVYGGLILGAFFMATDMVTTPMTIRGKILFGVGVGLITVVIRLWGAYPAFKPYVFGVVKPSKK